SVDSNRATGDDEESIEQYMAKLLERVQGTTSRVPPKPAAAEPAVAEPAVAEAQLPQDSVVVAARQPESESPQPMSEAEADRELATWRANENRPVTVVSSTDLGALRALANQTARRAISKHQLAKHRRDATTKVIVSMLAGATSLWLMMLAPNWQNIQFIV